MRTTVTSAIAIAFAGGLAIATASDVMSAAGRSGVQQMPPRDARPGAPASEGKQETDLKKALATAPNDTRLLIELAKLQEIRGAFAEAEATLMKARQLEPSNVAVYRALASVYNRSGQFDRSVEMVERAAELDPTNPEGHHVVGTYYFEKTRDQALTPAAKLTYIERGIAAEDRALAIKADYVDALVYKNLLLRVQAPLETDAARQQELLKLADALRNRALQLRQNAPAGTAIGVPVGAPPPPPPPPPLPVPGGPTPEQVAERYARTSYTSGSAAAPVKVKDVRPVYAPMAISAGVQGNVVVAATVDERGRVADARVVQSIPMLNQAVIDAVKQWEFEPIRVGGAPTQLAITVTANFTLPR